jgi:phage protein D
MANTSKASKKVSDAAKHRRSTSYTVSFPTLPFRKQPTTIDVHQSMNRHDVITLKWRTVSKKIVKTMKTGVPFKLTWTQGKQTRVIYCYVSHVTSETAGQLKTNMTIVATGGSYPLKSRSTKVYTKKTIPDVASLIAKKYRLKYLGTPHKHRYDQLAVSGHSDWEWLKEHARKIGYGLMVDGTNLIFKPLDKLLSQSVTNATVMSAFNIPLPINTMLFDRTLDYFKLISGENIETAKFQRAYKNMGGVNPQTGKAFTSKADPRKVGKNTRKKVSDVLFEEYMSNYSVISSAAAKMTAEAAAHLARLNIPAMVRGQGDPRLKPFAPVYITGISEEIDGYWVVNSVIHRLNFAGEYSVEMVVSTDGLGEPSSALQAPTNAGKIDVQAVLNGQLDLSSSTDRQVSLINKAGYYQENNQGFNRTPSTWQSNNIGPRKVC